jgi:hypothetical protein
MPCNHITYVYENPDNLNFVGIFISLLMRVEEQSIFKCVSCFEKYYLT